jgi:hypothetical protein
MIFLESLMLVSGAVVSSLDLVVHQQEPTVSKRTCLARLRVLCKSGRRKLRLRAPQLEKNTHNPSPSLTPVPDTRKGEAAEGDVEEEEDYELTDEEDRDSNTTTEDGTGSIARQLNS